VRWIVQWAAFAWAYFAAAEQAHRDSLFVPGFLLVLGIEMDLLTC
jgi:hypothetical protein